MADIPNTNYITINSDGVFVGGKPVTTYNGEKIRFINGVKTNFLEIQKQNPKVQELHVGAFETEGIFAKTGNPSGNLGKYAWTRVKMSDGYLSPWVFCYVFSSASVCASGCAHRCCFNTRYISALSSAMLKFTKKDKQR